MRWFQDGKGLLCFNATPIHYPPLQQVSTFDSYCSVRFRIAWSGVLAQCTAFERVQSVKHSLYLFVRRYFLIAFAIIILLLYVGILKVSSSSVHSRLDWRRWWLGTRR